MLLFSLTRLEPILKRRLCCCCCFVVFLVSFGLLRCFNPFLMRFRGNVEEQYSWHCVPGNSSLPVAEGQTPWTGGDFIFLTRNSKALVPHSPLWTDDFLELTKIIYLHWKLLNTWQLNILFFIFRYGLTMQLKLVLNSGSSCLSLSHTEVNYHTLLRNSIDSQYRKLKVTVGIPPPTPCRGLNRNLTHRQVFYPRPAFCNYFKWIYRNRDYFAFIWML